MNACHVCVLSPGRARAHVPRYCCMIYAELSLSFSIFSVLPPSRASAEIHSRADKWLNTRHEMTSISRLDAQGVPGGISAGHFCFCHRSSSVRATVIGRRSLLPSVPPSRLNLLFVSSEPHACTCSLPLRLIGKQEGRRDGRKEGRKEGRRKGKNALAPRSRLTARMDGWTGGRRAGGGRASRSETRTD